jgi:hypothetical protein
LSGIGGNSRHRRKCVRAIMRAAV